MNDINAQFIPSLPKDYREKIPFFIEFAFANVGPTAVASTTQQVGPRPFVVTHITAKATAVEFKFMVRDTGSGEAFMPNRVSLDAIVNAQENVRPFELPVRWRFPPNSGIFVEIENTDAAVTENLNVILCGYREG